MVSYFSPHLDIYRKESLRYKNYALLRSGSYWKMAKYGRFLPSKSRFIELQALFEAAFI
jgi:hypothetical protein